MTTIQKIKRNPKVVAMCGQHVEGVGFFVYLKPGWCWDHEGRHDIHEDTPRQCYDELRNLKRCCCKDCAKPRRGVEGNVRP